MTTIHITTDRLTIRSPTLADAPTVNAAIHASGEALRAWMPWAQSLPSLTETTDNLRDAMTQTLAGRDYRLLLFSHAGDFVGSSGLHQVDWRIAKAEIGYWAHQRFAGKGLISEAVAGITQHAHQVMGLRRVEILVSDRNHRSWRVAERCGYHLEAVLRHHRIDPDGQVDHTRIYASLSDHPRAVGYWSTINHQFCGPGSMTLRQEPEK